MLRTCNSELLENKKFKESEHCFIQLHKSLGEDKYVELKKTPKCTSNKETNKQKDKGQCRSLHSPHVETL